MRKMLNNVRMKCVLARMDLWLQIAVGVHLALLKIQMALLLAKVSILSLFCMLCSLIYICLCCKFDFVHEEVS